jgi:hypothetical protein
MKFSYRCDIALEDLRKRKVRKMLEKNAKISLKGLLCLKLGKTAYFG